MVDNPVKQYLCLHSRQTMRKQVRVPVISHQSRHWHSFGRVTAYNAQDISSAEVGIAWACAAARWIVNLLISSRGIDWMPAECGLSGLDRYNSRGTTWVSYVARSKVKC